VHVLALLNKFDPQTDTIIGRNRGLLELDLKLDDLLEMQKDNQEELDLEYVQFNVSKVLALLNKRFARKKGW
jgi:Ras GTPase-activating-like protein IQGAP2/3